MCVCVCFINLFIKFIVSGDSSERIIKILLLKFEEDATAVLPI